jgi:hypothetical protein
MSRLDFSGLGIKLTPEQRRKMGFEHAMVRAQIEAAKVADAIARVRAAIACDEADAEVRRQVKAEVHRRAEAEARRQADAEARRRAEAEAAEAAEVADAIARVGAVIACDEADAEVRRQAEARRQAEVRRQANRVQIIDRVINNGNWMTSRLKEFERLCERLSDDTRKCFLEAVSDNDCFVIAIHDAIIEAGIVSDNAADIAKGIKIDWKTFDDLIVHVQETKCRLVGKGNLFDGHGANNQAATDLINHITHKCRVKICLFRHIPDQKQIIDLKGACFIGEESNTPIFIYTSGGHFDALLTVAV